ncbi:hypothetical protein [Lyngbya confervoides]|uniref:Uncharacterized protein n=1 Tax=Lyngbya confervoides BDU141951 TaxID=1574623 RepID=A0ABD4T6L1_9CYAN|nr:hypothetical protein [Lyngbya confervoides]MCM1984101.1 hypothetical protein [Lyngbya confervoides BDU141951]
MIKPATVLPLTLLSVLTLASGQALAHSVQTDYLLSPESELSLDVTFSTGEPLQEAPVKVYAPNNPEKPWLEGTTDASGKFTFLPDSALAGDWTVEIGEYDHADILTVPVNQGGIQINDISRKSDQFQVAQRPSLSLSSEPAQALSSEWGSASAPAAALIQTSGQDFGFEAAATVLVTGGSAALILGRHRQRGNAKH